jgi:hypothetical protein
VAEQADHVSSSQDRSRVSELLDVCVSGFGFYYLTSLIVFVAAVFAVDFVPLCSEHWGSKTRVDLLSALAAWDGVWYGQIATQGYSYDPDQSSAVAFYPLYPMLAGALVRATGMRTEWALLLVSHGALVATFALLAAYVRQRGPAAEDDLPGWTLLAFGLFPTTFFFRMAYTESLFVMLMLLAMLGMERGWRPVWIALLIGLTTACRSVGVALVPVFAWYLWQRMKTERDCRSRKMGQAPGIHAPEPVPISGQSSVTGTKGSGLWGLGFRQWLAWAGRVSVLLPVCCWGLLAYMSFLWFVFGEPLAFVKTQAHWNERVVTLGDRVGGLLTLEPLRAVYDPASACYWGRVPPRSNPLFNLKAANPVYFLATVCLVGLGVWKRWLNAREVILALGLLGIAYWFQASRACMTSQARYASVVFPVYLVLGQLLHRAPAPLSAALLAISALLLGTYAMMFVSWYWFI